MKPKLSIENHLLGARTEKRPVNGTIIIPRRPRYRGFKYDYTVQGGTPASEWYQYQYQVGDWIESSVKINR